MIKNYVTDEWKIIENTHEKLDFVNVNLNNDNLLFIDPCLIEGLNDEWGNQASKVMASFFDEFYKAYQSKNLDLKMQLLKYAGEQNGTHLGYGKGYNGKGNTAKGLIEDFKPLEKLIEEINTIGVVQDLPVFIPGFAEDGLSDLLTNVLHEELRKFTNDQMKKHNVQPNGDISFYSWDIKNKTWKKSTYSCYFYQGIEVLLVPKKIVRKNYLFGTTQYLNRIILERVREEENWYDSDDKPIPKTEIRKNIQKVNQHWEYDYAIKYSMRHSVALEEYHDKMPKYYIENGSSMTDDKLDAELF